MASRVTRLRLGTALFPSFKIPISNINISRGLSTKVLRPSPRRATLGQCQYARRTIGARLLSNEAPQVRLYDFEAVKDISESPSPERVLIDVREPSEYQAGYIPSAINLPVISQPDALTMSEEDFEDRYGFAKPALDQEVVFYCKAGVRSGNAASIAQQQGYSNVSEYKGSWSDWTKRGGKEAL